jgi:Domain of unknown function (DUF4041)/Meiotically up-regulated gene 113
VTSQFLLGILLLLSGVYIFKLCEEKDRLKRMLARYESIISQEDYQEELNEKIVNQHNQVIYLEEQYRTFSRKVAEIKKELGLVEEELEIQSFGFYQTPNNFITSSEHHLNLKNIQKQQKQLVKNGKAIRCPVSWTVSNSEEDGKELVNNFSKLVIFIFNDKCDDLVAKMKPGRLEQSGVIARKKFLDLNKISNIMKCEITEDYLELKLRELNISHEFEIVKQEEKEIAKQAKLEDRERKVLEKVEREIREAEEREQGYQREIEIIREKLESSNQRKLILVEQEKEKLIYEIEKLQGSLREAQEDREAAETRSRLFKAGHVFVISNVGSFGSRDIYRICSTKSNNEDTYISTMTPVVPFPFDIHFKFFSSDVTETIKLLHDKFQDRRVNIANSRREFFNVSFEEISDAIDDIRQKTGNLKNFSVQEKYPTAYEYSQAQKNN